MKKNQKFQVLKMLEIIKKKELKKETEKLGYETILIEEETKIIGECTRENATKKNIKILTRAENLKKKDHTHYRRTKLTNVIAKLMKEKNKAYAFDLSQLRETKEPEIILGRMIQNAKILRKYKVTTFIATFATNKYELKTQKEKDFIAEFLKIKPLINRNFFKEER